MAFDGSVHSRQVVKTEEGFPTKLYNFTMAIRNGIFQDARSVRQYLLDILAQNPEIISDHTYAIAAGWGYLQNGEPVKAMDILSYKFDRPWNECNPDVDSWVFKNYERSPGRDATCGTTLIFLGDEERLRRKTGSLEQYLNSWPDLGDLGPSEVL